MSKFSKTLLVIITLIVLSILSAFVLYKYWQWFIIPIFGLNQITLVEALGLMSLISYFKLTSQKNNNVQEKTDDEFWNVFNDEVSFFISSFIVMLSFGWLLQLFM